MNQSTAQGTVEQPTQSAPKANNRRRKKILLVVAGVMIVAIAIYALYWFFVSRFVESTDDAYVQGNVVQITPQVAATVTKIYADDTDMVKPGQPLISLDSADADLAVQRAEAQLAQTVREVRTLYASQAQSSANLALREADLARARDDLARRKGLAGSGAVSGEEIRHAELGVTSAQAAVQVAREQLVSGRALTEGTTVAQHPNVLRAASQLQDALLAQSRTTLYAPVGGAVARRSVQVGQRVTPGSPVMSVVPLDQLWIDANFKESQLSQVQVGQPVTVVADLYGGKVKYDGRIAGMGAGTGSAFALLPAQNATGNWIKIVQRVPVRITVDPKQLAEHPLRIGLSVQADVDLHEKGKREDQRRSAATAPTTYTAAAGPNNDKAKARVDEIVAANIK
ncbi:MAG: HlyD family efflux transporter periplasmic adaptor subunit [Herminiimonas sp.]|nr:HlyD family efflux transporter periplasmic adaptor subunit [Herminiimonas sp.]